MRQLIGDKVYFSFGLMVVIITVVVWAVRLEGHAASDAKEVMFIREKLDIHEKRQDGLEGRISDSLLSIDQRLSRIEGRLKIN
jgi:hypothetical protein